MRNKLLLISLLASTSLLVACSAAPKVAQEKSVEVANQTLRFGGVYDVDKNELVLNVNGDPLLKGRFPPYTPTQNLSGQYKGMQIVGKCYFGSVLADKRGKIGLIASAIQSMNEKSNDKCEMHVNGKSVETLYF